jgi:F-type H+-transporting ATPase subunit delta
MKNVTVARRYARALYELAVETHQLSDVRQGLSNIALAMKDSPSVEKIFLNPLVKPNEKEALFKAVTSNKLILKFAGLLSKRKRLDLIPLINEQVGALADEADGVKRVLIKTAAPLSDDQRRDVERGLAGRLGGSVVGHFEVAQELIGGMWVQMGSKVLDLSLRGRFEDLKHHLAHSTN